MTDPAPAAWIAVVDISAIGRQRATLRETLREVAKRVAAVDVEERGDGLLLRVPPGVHPAGVAVRLPALLDAALTGDARVRLVIDVGPAPDQASRLAAVLRGSPADPPLVVAITEGAWRALSRGDQPVPLRGYRRTTIYHRGEELVAWLRVPDEPDTAVPQDRYNPGTYPGAGKGLGPPPGPEFPTDR